MGEGVDRAFTYPGSDLDARWDGRLCIHQAECTRAEGHIFQSGRSPWGQPDLADADVVAEVVRRCPSGALTYERRDGGAPEVPDGENRVHVTSRGPLFLRGDLRIEGAPDDMPGVRTRAALCRCGRSSNKPFCDNSHEGAGFADRGAVGRSGETQGAVGGPLDVRPAQDGPLLLTGNVTITAGDGRRAWRGDKVALCRCGQSSGKPFCDGTHASVGFRS